MGEYCIKRGMYFVKAHDWVQAHDYFDRSSQYASAAKQILDIIDPESFILATGLYETAMQLRGIVGPALNNINMTKKEKISIDERIKDIMVME